MNYIDNEAFYLAMVRYKQQYEESRKLGLTKPPISNYIGACILKIAYKLSTHKSFIGYTTQWKEEMRSDGIENCLQYCHNFDPDKTNNPLAYFTQIIWYAFIRRIHKEKKQQYIKAKNLQMIAISNSLTDEDITNNIMPTDALNELIDSFENPVNKKPKEKKPVGVEKYMSKKDV